MLGQLRHHPVAPFRLLDFAADELPHLPIQLDQRRIHRLHRTLPRGMDQLRDLVEIGLWVELCRHVVLRISNFPLCCID
jgi:hypothetical protein